MELLLGELLGDMAGGCGSTGKVGAERRRSAIS
jgi:hypothetical protein